MFALPGAVGFGGTVRFGCHCWQENSDAADQRPNIGNRFTHDRVAARIVASLRPGFESLQLIVVFASLTLVWLSLYALAVDRAAALLRRPRVRRTLDAVTGCALAAFGFRLATE